VNKRGRHSLFQAFHRFLPLDELAKGHAAKEQRLTAASRLVRILASRIFEKWQGAKGVFAPSKTRADAIEKILPQTAPRIAADAAIECINCAVCFAACDTVRWNEDYLGPASLNRAWTLVNDVRDAGGRERLAALAASGGCHACH